MHPLLADRRRWQVLLAAWGAVGVAVALLVHALLDVPWVDALVFGVPLGLAAAPVSLSAWYICRATPLARTPVSRVVTTAVSAALVTAGLWAGVGWGWWSLLVAAGVSAAPVAVRVLVTLLVGVGGFAYLLALAVTYLIETFEAQAEASRRVLESQIAQRDAELAMLRAQIDPHFLFNSLTSVAGLIAPEPARAREMCQRLADFFRDSLALGSASRIPLSREVALAVQYLAIEQVRFGARLRVVAQVPADVASTPVPALLLQPIVENAVRHGIATTLDGGTVEIAARLAGERAVITVMNPRDPDSRRPGTGLGQSIVRRRLQAAFGDAAALVVEPRETSYVATVTVPVR